MPSYPPAQAEEPGASPTGNAARWFFFITLAIGGVLLAVALHQVPQPWRGVLVVWLALAATLGVLVVKALKHYFAYKAAQVSAPQRKPTRPRPEPTRHREFEGLRVVYSDTAGAGRHTIR